MTGRADTGGVTAPALQWQARAEALAWLGSQVRWERTLEALRAAGEAAGGPVDLTAERAGRVETAA